MTEQVAVTIEDVRRVAELANLDLTPEEEPQMQRDLNAILVYVAQLNELDTSNIPAMAQVGQIILSAEILTGEILPHAPSATGTALRPDAVRPSLDRASVMAAAPETDGRFFKVPKVIER